VKDPEQSLEQAIYEHILRFPKSGSIRWRLAVRRLADASRERSRLSSKNTTPRNAAEIGALWFPLRGRRALACGL
jgi:hypothetical protein